MPSILRAADGPLQHALDEVRVTIWVYVTLDDYAELPAATLSEDWFSTEVHAL